ncbi:hypothetical protein JCM33374_g5198 [Metschnikowia sp. JCM 33374]|nr:hypothetical protein JCM33374_g5198 [Metschnikowia sp. JCM 33374]
MTSQLEVVLAPVKNEIPERSLLEAMYIRSIVVSMNSFSFKGADGSDKETENIVINSIQSLAKIFKNQALMTKDEILMLSQNERPKESNMWKKVFRTRYLRSLCKYSMSSR